jgi:hypothetical protein
MAQLKLRRAAAVLVLALSLLPVSSAQAATRAHSHSAAAHGTGVVARVTRAVIDVLAKAGVRIDPNGTIEINSGH